MMFSIGLSRRFSSFKRDQRGVSAVEFAMLLPLMITLYLGTVEISQGVAINRKVTLTTRTVADLASQVSSINSADMSNLLKASAAVIAPFDTNQLKVTVSQVKIDANGNATIDWSETLNGTKRATGSSIALPTALNVPDTQLIFSEVSYNYTPTIGYVVTGSLNLADKIYMRPRLSDKVTYSPT
ncbi:MAG: TadE/TadG family type IV pilus assembly protein [Xanthobacteraceae bacterium]